MNVMSQKRELRMLAPSAGCEELLSTPSPPLSYTQLIALPGLQVGFLLCLHSASLLCLATSVNESSLFMRTLAIWTYLDDLIWA